MLISCWCWWWTAGWCCYCCWFLRGRDCSSSCRLGGEWTLTEWTRLSAPLSSGLSTHSLLRWPGCWPRWSSGHSVILIQICHFCICIRVHIPCTCLHVLSLPPSTCWLLTLLLFIVSTLQSFGRFREFLRNCNARNYAINKPYFLSCSWQYAGGNCVW